MVRASGRDVLAGEVAEFWRVGGLETTSERRWCTIQRMRRTTFRLALLGLAGTASACQQHYELRVHPPAVSAANVTFAWDGDPARTISVYRCAATCPPLSTLPSYGDETDPKPGELVWDISAVGSPADGAGTIAYPLVYGDSEHPKAVVGTAPAQLTPGNYLLRVVTFKGVQMKAHIGTGWSTFVVPDNTAAD